MCFPATIIQLAYFQQFIIFTFANGEGIVIFVVENPVWRNMRLHINSETRLPDIRIKKIRINRIDEEFKNICHFLYNDVQYVIDDKYEVYEVNLELSEDEGTCGLLSVLEYGKYKGSYKNALKNRISTDFPATYDREVIKDWCKEETEKVLAMCQVIK